MPEEVSKKKKKTKQTNKKKTTNLHEKQMITKTGTLASCPISFL
jgi:hypothetical protein